MVFSKNNRADINKIFSSLHGNTKAAQGFIINDGENFFHAQDILLKQDLEGLTQEECFYLAFCSKKEIIRLREIKNAHDYLLKLRADAIVDAARSVRVMRHRRKKYEKSGNTWHLSHYYHSLDCYHKEYIKKISKQQRKNIKQIPSGFMLINSIDAQCRKSFVGNIVIASENIIHFCYFMTIAFFGHSYGIDEQDCHVALVIAMRIMLGSESLDFDLDPRCILDKRTELKIMEKVALQLQFVFGHEYAHITLGHLSNSTAKWINYPCTTKKEVEISSYNHELEFDADYNAIHNIVSSRSDKKEILEAALDFLIFIDIYYQFNMKNLASATHPHPIDRFNMLINRCTKLLGSSKDKMLCFYTKTRNIGKSIREIFKIISTEQNIDAINFYGSIYLSSYKHYIPRDRIDY